jgi:hypothetical protein
MGKPVGEGKVSKRFSPDESLTDELDGRHNLCFKNTCGGSIATIWTA